MIYRLLGSLISRFLVDNGSSWETLVYSKCYFDKASDVLAPVGENFFLFQCMLITINGIDKLLCLICSLYITGILKTIFCLILPQNPLLKNVLHKILFVGSFTSRPVFFRKVKIWLNSTRHVRFYTMF